MRRLKLFAWSLCFPILGVILFVSTAFSQNLSNKLFLPLLNEHPILGTYPEILPQDCERFGLAASSRYFSNGTSFFAIAHEYHMFAIEVRDLNRDFFPNLVVDSATGHSRICLYKDYNVSAFPNFAGGEETLVLNWTEGVPDWQNNLWQQAEVMASQTQTETYTILFGLVAVPASWGVPTVGTVELGGQTIGKIVKGVSGASAMQFLGRAISGFVLVDALYDRIDAATTEGLELPATLLADDAAIIYYAENTETAYLRYYEDASLAADNMLVPNIRRLYFTGVGNEGLIISSEPQGGMGDVAYPFDVLHWTAMDLVAERKTNPLTEADAKRAMEGVDEFFRVTDEKTGNDPI